MGVRTACLSCLGIGIALAASLGVARAACTTSSNTVNCTGGPGASIILANSDNTTHPGTPFPAAITVTGGDGTVQSVSITLHGYTSSVRPGQASRDMGLLLVSPSGRNMELLRCPGSGGVAQRNMTVTLQDGGAPIPSCRPADGGAFGNWTASGTYAPAAYANGPLDYAQAGAPALQAGHSPSNQGSATLNSIFGGDSVNGDWNLYLVDNSAGGASVSFSSWDISITFSASTSSSTTLAATQTTVTFTITNPAENTVSQTGVAFSDTMPAGLVVATIPGVINGCGGSVTATPNSGLISLAGGTVARNMNCTITVNVMGTTEGQKDNTTGPVSSANGGTGVASNTATTTVAAAPVINKSFGSGLIQQNTNTVLTFNITNPNSVVTLTGVAFNDSLPPGLVVASPNNLTNSCGGLATAGVGGSSVSLSGGTLAPGAVCTVLVNLTGTAPGTKNNTVQVNSTEAGLGNTSNASIVVVAPPMINKSFSAASIPLNGTATVTFTVLNPNSGAGLTGVGFNDPLPAGLVVASIPNLINTCNGTPTATGGTIGLSFGTIVAGGSCTLKVDVTGTTTGDKPNTTGPIGSTEGGMGNKSNTATLTVVAPPVFAKAFGAAHIAVQGITSLTFTITNPSANAVSQAGVAFTDALPTGLLVSSNSPINTCGGIATAPPSSPTIVLTGGTVGGNASCTLFVNVVGTSAGVKNNTSGAISSTTGGTGNTASASVIVATPPSISKAFLPASIFLNGVSTLSFGINNSNVGLALTGVQFSDSLPVGVQVASPTGAANTCAGTFNPAAGDTSLSLSVGTVASNSSCTISVNVIGTSAGSKSNTSGVISSNESGPGAGSNTAALIVVAPPSISKGFAPTSIQVNGTSTLTFNIVNPAANTVVQNGLAFSDPLPAGLVVANPPNAVNTCGGSLTAAAGTGVVSLSNGTLAMGSSCSVSVNVTSTTGGDKNNITGSVSSTNGGPGNTATATLTAMTPITVNTSPAGRSFTVDGITYTSAQSFAWTFGSSHTLSTAPYQLGTPGTQYVWNNWSDGGAISHSVTAPSGPITFTANFVTQYGLITLVSPDAGGIVDAGPGDFFNAGTVVPLTAKAASCFTFSGWTGPVASASSASTSVTMSGPQTVTANFTAVPGCRGGGRPVLTLFATPAAGGTIVGTPGPDASNTYDPGASIQIKAQASPGYLFLGFSGDLSGATNPQMLLMNGSKTVIANFVKIPDNPEEFDFGVQKGNPLPPAQFVSFDGVLFGVFSDSGGNWLLAAVGDDSRPQLSLNAAVVNALGEGTYTSYVVVGSFTAPRVIRVRLLIDVLQINQVTDSAGYRPLLISSDGLFTVFGINLSNQKVQASVLPLTASLGGSAITITDSAGVVRSGLLVYVAPDQINLLSPPGLAAGPATLTITNWAGLSGSFGVQAASVAPGLFAADASGKGPAAAVVLTVAADGTRTSAAAADCKSTPGKCVALPIDLGGPNDSVFLSFYGTGLRGRTSLSNVAVTIGGLAVDALYAGLQSQYPGLDQINVLLPRALAGRGEVDVVVSVDGRATNVVRIAIR